MSQPFRVIGTTVGVLGFLIVFLAVLPSLIGLLMGVILFCVGFDWMSRRRRVVARDFNSALRAVCRKEGSIGKLAVAFSRQGPLSGPCYEYARRMMMGEHPVDAAAESGIPLQLSTAIVLESPEIDIQRGQLTDDAIENSLGRDTGAMPVYAQLVYLTVTACTTCLVLTFVGLMIMPTVEKMFEEFGLAIRYRSFLSSVPAYCTFGLVAMIAFVAAPILNRGHLLGMRLSWIPMLPSVAERQAETLRGLADAIDIGWPMGRALALAHTIALRRDERRRLELAMRTIEQGLPANEALQRAGWIDEKESSWLADTPPARTAELLRSIADQTLLDARANLSWLMSIVFPVIVLLLGAVVLAYAFGFYGTLLELVNGLS